MPSLSQNLILDRCPHCRVAKPNLHRHANLQTTDHTGMTRRMWAFYICSTCGCVVSAWAHDGHLDVVDYFPDLPQVSEDIPERPRAYLQQAQDTIHAPAASIMCAASAVDAMLKLKGYKDGGLYSRIDKAAE